MTNGKLDRKALPEVDVTTAYVAPRTAEEAAMCALWQDLLGVARIGLHDDWFALGGHSILAMRLAQRTGYAVPTILANPTVAALCAAEADAVALPSTTSEADAVALPSTTSNAIFWHEERMSRGSLHIHSLMYVCKYAAKGDFHLQGAPASKP